MPAFRIRKRPMIPLLQIPTALVELGDADPAFAIACLSLAALGARGTWRRAALFVGIVLAALALMVVSKVVFYALDPGFGKAAFHGGSGHATRAFAMYPTFAWIVFAGSSRVRRLIGVGIGVLIAFDVTIATIVTGMHTPAEAFLGALIGAAVPIAMTRSGELKPLPDLLQAALILCAIALCATVPVMPYDFEKMIAHFARHLR